MSRTVWGIDLRLLYEEGGRIYIPVACGLWRDASDGAKEDGVHSPGTSASSESGRRAG